MLDSAGVVTARMLGLPGGVTVTRQASGDVWSYPNVHGDVAATTNSAGVKTSPTLRYDPFGNPLAGVADNLPGDYDYAWLGTKTRPVEHQPGLRPTIEMGARPYDPALGRFLTIDPIPGGTANNYDYTNQNPIGATDLGGLLMPCGATGTTNCNHGHQGAIGKVARKILRERDRQRRRIIDQGVMNGGFHIIRPGAEHAPGESRRSIRCSREGMGGIGHGSTVGRMNWGPLRTVFSVGKAIVKGVIGCAKAAPFGSIGGGAAAAELGPEAIPFGGLAGGLAGCGYGAAQANNPGMPPGAPILPR
ncbi:MAG TPA: RHS repeat-associated core domain-containing protein [Acidimicrobiales bacterium]|nr:RHS repeat-associated core domain-containing protein [Acidimicrobiales bacterium]